MSVGDIAGLIAAIVFAILAGFMIYPLIRLGRLLDQVSKTVKQTGDHALPAIDESVTTVKEVNKTLKDINQISDSAQYTARNAGALTDLYASILSKPAIAVASWTSAVSDTFRSFFGRKKKKTDQQKKASTASGTVAGQKAGLRVSTSAPHGRHSAQAR